MASWYHQTVPKFLTSVPKSGTYLLRHILRMDWPNQEGYHRRVACQTPRGWHEEHLYYSPAGHHVRGHIVCAEQTKNMVGGRTVFFLYRDPRDLMVSWAHYVDVIPRENPLANKFDVNLKDQEDKLAALIHNLPEWFGYFIGWMDHNIIPVRYEGLINNPEEELERAAEVLPEPLDYLVERSKMRSGPTYRRAKIGGWREEFQHHHTVTFEKYWSEIMDRLGYE